MSSDSSDTQREPDRLSMDRLSKELRMSLVETLGSPVLQLFLDGKYAGSGVLVEVDDVSGILTAEHVI
ncbi:MAG TPA: hypothetical protein VGX93_08520, partial [Chthoniobacterales bacterium]|nr:hypothetical protein [Chthoniobacterales bacterium]